MFKNYKSKRTPQFMIIPMIDIIFFLLVFFMMNSMQIITLDEEGHITMDNKPVTIDEASQIMTQRMAENSNAAVILQADKRTAHGQVVAVMDMLKTAGVRRLAVAAEQKG